jgi:hypothetical protein
MLIARATSELCRLIAADAVLGIGYSAEEIYDEQPEKIERRTARRRQQPATPATPATPAAPAEPELAAAPGPTAPETDDAPEPALDDTPDPITDKQLTALNAALTQDLDIHDRAAKLAYELGREITSSKDVTKAEAMRLLDQLADRMPAAEAAEPELKEPQQ